MTCEWNVQGRTVKNGNRYKNHNNFSATNECKMQYKFEHTVSLNIAHFSQIFTDNTEHVGLRLCSGNLHGYWRKSTLVFREYNSVFTYISIVPWIFTENSENVLQRSVNIHGKWHLALNVKCNNDYVHNDESLHGHCKNGLTDWTIGLTAIRPSG